MQRVNAALALIGRGSSDQAFYDALLQRLNETARVPDTALRELAGERAQAVVEYLSTVLAVPPARSEARSAGAPGSNQVKLTFDAAGIAAAEKSGGAQEDGSRRTCFQAPGTLAHCAAARRYCRQSLSAIHPRIQSPVELQVRPPLPNGDIARCAVRDQLPDLLRFAMLARISLSAG